MDVREKLVEILKQAPFEGKVLDEWWWEEKIARIADHLIANGVTVQEWISVTERLPDHSEIVLCRLTFNELRILQWDNVSKWWLGYGAGDDWSQKDVTHWMPLPKTPKEKDNE